MVSKQVIYTLKLLVSLLLVIISLLIIVKLFYYIISIIYNNPFTRFEPQNIKNILGDILLVLVLIELLRTVYIYLTNQDVYLNALIEAALVAVLRKIILIEVEKLEPLYILSLTVLFSAIAYIYFRYRN